MAIQWDEVALRQYIDNETEESLTLDYKAGDALDRTDKKKVEITKDVSAMANSAGGTIIYGIKEYDDPSKRHLPESIAPINRTLFSKEWLEQVINNIRPRVSNIVIHPVNLSSGSNDVAYVVEVSQSNTAHQALDFRYYKRFNFQSVPMADYEIRDVINRASTPEAAVEFKYQTKGMHSSVHTYKLEVYVRNLGIQVINNFQLEFTFPRIIGYARNLIHKKENIDLGSIETGDYLITYRSKTVLFPNEKRDIGREIVWDYEMNSEKYGKLRSLELTGEEVSVWWTLYADNMPPKQDKVPFKTLHNY